MSKRPPRKKVKKFTENRLEKKRSTVAELEELRVRQESRKLQRSRSLKVVRAIRKKSEPTNLTLVFSTILNLFLGGGFTLMLTSTYDLPVNIYIFLPILLLLALGMSYCHAQKGKLSPILLAVLLALVVRCVFMTDIGRINTQTRYAYSVLQQRVFHGLKPMFATAEELREKRRDITLLLLLINFIPTYFTAMVIEKRRHILLSVIWYLPLLFCATVTARTTPDAFPCQFAVAGILLLLIFQFVRRLGDVKTDKRMLLITVPVLLLCLLIGGLFPQEGYSYNKMAASHFEDLQGWVKNMGRRLKIGSRDENEEDMTEKHDAGYMGSITFDDEQDLVFMNVLDEDLSKVGYFDPPDRKIMSISRRFNDTENHQVTRISPRIYLRSTSMEYFEGNRWRSHSTSEEKDPTYFYTEESSSPQRESDFVIRIQTYFPFDFYLIPSYTDHFYISSASQYADLNIETRTTWNLHESIANNGMSEYDFAFNMVPQKAAPEWNPDYLAVEVYGTCLEVPEETRNGILNSNKLPAWFKEVLDGTRTMTAGEKVTAVVEYVRDLHSYDINTPFPPEDADFVTWFLTESETGFCVHYATTAAVLLRLIGVPTRYATGYLAYSDPYVAVNEVSMQDAHAWFEYFDPTYGWVLDDATPGKTIIANYHNPQAIAMEYEDENYILQPTSTPTPMPTKKPTKKTTVAPTRKVRLTATPVPEKSSGFSITIPPAVYIVLACLAFTAAFIGLLRLLYILFWKKRFKNDSLNKQAIEYNRYFNMHLHILEAPRSRVVRVIVDKAEYGRNEITEEELARLIRFGQHNLEIQTPGRNILRRMISKVLRIKL